VHGTGKKKEQAISNINQSGAPSSWDSVDMSFRSEKPRATNSKLLIESATIENEDEHNETISLDGDEVNRLN
jgi:hypothetical protein